MDNEEHQMMRKNFNNYLLHNQASFKDQDALDQMHNIMYGGNDCKSNNNIFKWTMQSLNKNQRTISGDKLIGGRVVMPSNFFNPSSAFPTCAKKAAIMSDVTPTTIRPALNSSFKVGGKNVVSKKAFVSMLKQNGGSQMKLSNTDVDTLYNGYKENLNYFMSNLDSLKSGGRPISKNTITRAFSALKKK